MSSEAEAFRGHYSFTLYFLPLAGVVIALMYKWLVGDKDKGTNLVLLAIRDNENMGFRNALCIFAASVLTHLCGGSSGREGASLQIGAALGSRFGRIMKLDDEDRRILTMTSMSAMFSAVFGTPVTAAIFSMEVVSIGSFRYSAIVPCVISALTANAVSSAFGTAHMHFSVDVPEATAVNYGKAIVLAVLCALLSIIFCMSIKYGGKLFGRIKNTSLRAAVGGAVIIVLTLVCGTDIYNGTGGAMIMSAFEERPFALAFAVKLLFTAVTLGAGYKGGEILPVLFIGSSFGSVFSQLLSMDCSMGAAIGAAALFCGVTNCPMASLFLCTELFGGEGIVFYALVCAVSYMLSGYVGLYSEQKIVYSKIKNRYIDKRVGDNT